MSSENYWISKYRRVSRRGVLRGASLAGAGLAGAALVGCGDDDDDNGVTPTSGTPTPGTQAGPTQVNYAGMSESEFLDAIPEVPPKDWEDKDIKTGGRLTRLYNREVSLDFVATTLTGPISELITPVYSRLIRLSNNADLTSAIVPVLEPDLATSWERPDAETIVLTLADGVKFHDVDPLNGRPLTADDIVYTFDRGKTYQTSAYKAFFNTVSSVEDVGGGKVRFNLNGPHPVVEQLFASFFMSIIPPEIGDNPDIAKEKAVGTGGMILDRHTPNVEYTYRKNPDFFKKDASGRQKPYIDGYSLAIVQDQAARLAKFESKEADFYYGAAAPLGLDELHGFVRRNPNVVVQKRPAPNPSFALVGHHGESPWNDIKVRRAASLLLDRKSIIDSLYKGHAMVGPYFPFSAVYDQKPTLDQLGPNFKFDPKEAKDLLNAAGYADGLEMELHFYTSGNLEDQVVVYQQTAAQAGLNFKLVKAADAAAHAQKQTSKSWNGLITVGRGLDFPDPMASLPSFLPGVGTNQGDVNDPKLVELYEKQKTTIGDERTAAVKEVWDYLLEQKYEVELPAADFIMMWWPWVKNWRDAIWHANVGFGSGNMDSIWIGEKS